MPWTDRQDSSPAGACPRCGGEVWSGEILYRWEGRPVCEDCLKAAVSALLEEDPRQVALEMGLDMERAGKGGGPG